MRVLVVDDEPATLKFISETLKSLYIVDCAGNALAGLELLKMNTYDYVLIDYVMPEHNGAWFLENATLPPATKVILVTGHADREFIEEMFKLGASAYLIKPFLKKELLEILALSPGKKKEAQRLTSDVRGPIKGLKEIFLQSAFLRRTFIAIWHIIGICFAHWLAFQLRFDFNVPLSEQITFLNTLPILLIVCLLVFHLFRMYSGLWAYFSIDDVAKTALAVLCAITISAFLIFASKGFTFAGIPRSMFFLDYLFIGGWIGGGRFAIRYFRQHRGMDYKQDEDRIVLVGRTEDVDLLIRGTRNVRLGKFVAIVTDDPGQEGMTIHGIGISGIFSEIAGIVEKNRASCVLILPPFNKPGQMNDIVDQCSLIKRPLSFRTIPSLAELATGRLSTSSIRNVDIEDLLGRGTADVDRSEVRRFVKGKKVMITGAGGSIGQELCRQIAGYEPACMVLFEISEFGLYEIERKLRQQYPNLDMTAFAGDVRHPEEINAAIDQAGGIDIIYHSAAYKHVPLMETNVAACFRTNVLGTARLARVAIERKVDRFVMISSDKAVRPTSMMGVTKRIAERVIAELPSNGTTFVSVRFGNVLESSGSVIPLFKEQIARGGPVTVTSPDVKRFFMTIPEAVNLILLAGTIGRNGEIMVLDMGESIKIVDLARKLIELSGLIPEKDIKIEFTGLRPGEKEFEEVMTEDENVVQTAYKSIWVFKKRDDHAGKAVHIDLSQIEQSVLKNDENKLRGLARKYVPENMFAVGGLGEGQVETVTRGRREWEGRSDEDLAGSSAR